MTVSCGKFSLIIIIFRQVMLSHSACIYISSRQLSCSEQTAASSGVTCLSHSRKNSLWSNYLTGVFLKARH
jgi:hypothetical protein